MNNKKMIMGIENPLLVVFLPFVGSAILSALNLGFITAVTVTAQFNDSGYTARTIFRWLLPQPITSASATLSVWNPSVVRGGDYSVGKIAIVYVNRTDNITASMEAGYIVFPQRYGNNSTRFYIKWKNIAANGTVTGCFDLDCPGFMPTNGGRGRIGKRLFPSEVGEPPQSATTIVLMIRQVNQGGNWVLSRNNLVLGKWPDSLFTAKGNARFNAAEIGGEVYDSTGDTTPRSQMGDGQFPSSINNTGAFFYDTTVTDKQTVYGIGVPIIQPIATNLDCYRADFTYSIMQVTGGPALYYGGPGCST